MRQSKYFVSSSSCLVTKLEICCQNSSLIKLLNHSILLFLIFLVMCLRGMLHVGEVKFTLGWNFNLGWIFFEIQVPFTSGRKLKISTPRWNGYFDLSAWYFICFHFIKIQSYNCYITYKLEKKKKAVLINSL